MKRTRHDPNSAAGRDAGAPRGWYSRQYLPHFDEPALLQSITFRLHDAVPVTVIQDWKTELNFAEKLPATDPREIELRKRIARYEDAHHGACWLSRPPIAQMVEDALLYFDGQRYNLHAWCIMPNHVHVLIQTLEGYRLDGILHTWKSYSAQRANGILQRKGPFWFREYFDRFIRNEKHYHNTVFYIEQNPAKAGLIDSAEAWPFGSARRRITSPGAPASLPATAQKKEAAKDGGAPQAAKDAAAPKENHSGPQQA